jgi:hypothetical protein
MLVFSLCVVAELSVAPANRILLAPPYQYSTPPHLARHHRGYHLMVCYLYICSLPNPLFRFAKSINKTVITFLCQYSNKQKCTVSLLVLFGVRSVYHNNNFQYFFFLIYGNFLTSRRNPEAAVPLSAFHNLLWMVFRVAELTITVYNLHIKELINNRQLCNIYSTQLPHPFFCTLLNAIFYFKLKSCKCVLQRYAYSVQAILLYMMLM